MGGDHGPAVTLPACRAFLAAHPEAELVLVGRAEALARGRGWPRCTLRRRERGRRDGRLGRGRAAAQEGFVAARRGQPGQAATPTARSLAQACVSAGNTGALMAVSRYVLKTLDGIDRPAIATVMPNERDGFTTVLDLGANVDCTRRAPAAVRGDGQRAGRRASTARTSPSVGLLNIGEEAIKGSETIKRAGELLRAAAAAGHLNFHGNVEGNDIFKGTTDIVVCDGFVGNVALKTAEGPGVDADAASSSRSSRATPLTKLAALAALPVLNRFKRARRPSPLQRRARCSACAGWSSRATARPTPSRSSRR